MAISVTGQFTANESSSGATVVLSSQTPASGSCIVVGVALDSRLLSVVDSLGNVFRIIGTFGPSAGGHFIGVAYLPGTSASARTITLTQAGSATMTAGALIIGGLATRYPFDNYQVGIGTSTNMDSGALNTPTRYPNSILVGIGGNGPASVTWTAGSGFTVNATASLAAGGSFPNLAIESEVVSSVSAYNAPTTSSSSRAFVQVLAVFSDTDVPGASWPERITRHPGRSPGLAGVSARFAQPATARNAVGSLRVGDAAITEAPDTLTAAGSVAVQGVASLTQAAETVSSAGSVKVAGTAALSQDNELLVATGTVTQPTVTTAAAGTGAGTAPARHRRRLQPVWGNGWLTQDDQKLVATGTTHAHTRQEDQKAAGAGRVLILGKCSTCAASSKLRASGRLLIKGGGHPHQRAGWLTGAGKVMARGWGHVKAQDARAHGAGRVDWSGAIAREDDALARGNWMLDLFEE